MATDSNKNHNSNAPKAINISKDLNCNSISIWNGLRYTKPIDGKREGIPEDIVEDH